LRLTAPGPGSGARHTDRWTSALPPGENVAGAGVASPAPAGFGMGQVTTMPAGAAPAGSGVGELASSVRLPPWTANEATAPAALSSRYR
jgi:hypothetical protein